MQELVTSMLNSMQNHLTVFNLKSVDDLLQIKHMIQYVSILHAELLDSLLFLCSTLQTIYSFPEVVERLGVENRDLKSALVLTIQVKYYPSSAQRKLSSKQWCSWIAIIFTRA